MPAAARPESARGWEISSDEGARWEADVVIVTAPAPQSLALVDAGGVALDAATRATLQGIEYERCLAGLFEGPWPMSLPSHGVARVEGDPLAWLASNRAKGISEAPTITAHATAAWSLARWDDDDAAALDALGAATTRPPPTSPASRGCTGRWRAPEGLSAPPRGRCAARG